MSSSYLDFSFTVPVLFELYLRELTREGSTQVKSLAPRTGILSVMQPIDRTRGVHCLSLTTQLNPASSGAVMPAICTPNLPRG